MNKNTLFLSHIGAILAIFIVSFLLAARLEDVFGIGLLWWPLIMLPSLFAIGTLALSLDRLMALPPRPGDPPLPPDAA